MRLYCEHEIPWSADAFWERIHSELFEARVREALGLNEYKELERGEDESELFRRIRVSAPMPKGMAPLVARVVRVDEAVIFEEQWRSKRERLVRWRMTPSVMADRVRVEGVLRVEPAGRARCRRILEGTIEARLFGLGMLLERAALKELISA